MIRRFLYFVAVSLLLQFAHVGSAEAQLEGVAPVGAGPGEGWASYKRGDYAAALREWRPLAVQGNATAQFNVAVMYWGSNFPPISRREVKKQLRKVEEQRDARPEDVFAAEMRNWGSGKGVLRDHTEAAKWFRKAADQGHVEAQY